MPGSFSFRKIQKGKGEVTAKLVGGVQFLLKKCGVTVINGEASLEKNRVVRCGGPGVQGEKCGDRHRLGPHDGAHPRP